MLIALCGGAVALLAPQSTWAGDDDLPAVAPDAEQPVERPDRPDDEAPKAKPADHDEEPPLELTIEIDGKAADVQLDRATTVEVNGKQVEIRLTAKPDRLFQGGGVSFRYPRQHAFAVERDEGTTTWTFDGNENVLMLLHYALALDADELAREVADSMVAQYGEGNSRTRATSIDLAGRQRQGTRVEATVVGENVVQEVFSWQRGPDGPTYVLILQDSPPAAGGASDESRQVRDLLVQTFKHGPR